ncbi:hypothetical protein Tco_0429566 [Tanacetum coccineum]
MADLAFVNQHNMVAYLEKRDENAEFHQIVDFLSTCSINYALTVSPTIYASYIEQFWNTATYKTVNSVKQIHAIVDGKAVVISESSVRNDLLFDDEDGITCLTNADIFENLALMGSERVLEKPNEPPLSEVHTSESGERNMEHTFELMDTVPPTPHDSPLTRGYTPRSNEGRLKLKELMAMCTKLSKQVLDLEKEKDAQAVEILKLKQRFKKLERKRKSSISNLRRRIYRQVESSDNDLDDEDASKEGRTSDKTKPMFKDGNFDDLDDLVDEGMAFVQEKYVENQGKIINIAGEGVSTAAPRTPPIITTVFDDEDVTNYSYGSDFDKDEGRES